MPGHKAKLQGFFSVIDEMYPRGLVAEQIKAFTPSSRSNPKKGKRLSSATRIRGGQVQSSEMYRCAN